MNESIKDRFLKEHALTDEQLKQVSGGAFIDANRGIGCPNSNDCEGYLVHQCQFTDCPNGYK